MNNKIIKNKIEQLIRSMYPTIDLTSLYKEVPMVTVLNMDSIGFVSFIIAVEESVGFQIKSVDIYNTNILLVDFLSIIEEEVV